MNFDNINVVRYRESVPFNIVEVSGKPIFELIHNNEVKLYNWSWSIYFAV